MSIAKTPEQIEQNKSRNEKFLTLHHELLYPAFLGAVLFEFARKCLPGFLPVDSCLTSNIAWFTLNFRWFLTALCFMLYFVIAFLALHEARTCAKSREHFGWIPFLANFVEIVVILLVLVGISPDETESTHAPKLLKLNYAYIFSVWMLIPVTAAISNYASRRIVHGTISLFAFVLGAIGLYLNRGTYWEQGYWYGVLLAAMYLALGAYGRSVFRPVEASPRRWLRFQMRDDCRWPEWACRAACGKSPQQ